MGRHTVLSLIGGAGCLASLAAADWPQWGGSATRAMVSSEKGIPDSFDPGEKKRDGSGVDMATTKNVAWAVKLGSETYGTPTISGGKVFVGTNNGSPRDQRVGGDRGILMCFEERSGKFLWQLVVSKLRDESNFNGDFPHLGICSSPTVEGNRAYVVTSRCEVLCLDVEGCADGNDGPFVDEAEYMTVPVRQKPGKLPDGVPRALAEKPARLVLPGPQDADIIWRYDMIAELDVWPQDATNCSVSLLGDLLYVCTSNGVDKSHERRPSPQAPSLIALDKRTGALVAADDAGIGPRIFHGQWSSPSLAKVGERTLVLFGGGDGFCYAFDAAPVAVEGKGTKILKTVWKCDCNPPEYTVRDGKPLPYNKNGDGPSEVIATPVFWKDRVYVTVGQDTRHGPGKGAVTCIDATGTGDVTATGKLWTYTGINRSFSTPSVFDGVVFVADVLGTVHCLDASTGACLWTHETKAETMGSTFVVDGRLLLGNASGKLFTFAAGREKKLLNQIQLGAPIHCTPVVANGVLYVATHTYLYAVEARQGKPQT